VDWYHFYDPEYFGQGLDLNIQ